MEIDSEKSLYRSTRHFFYGTFLSRFGGMLRDLSMGFCFGDSPKLAAFFVAFRLANIFRRLLGEGSLQSGFIPYFESAKAESPKKAAEFTRDLFYSLTLFLIGVVIASEGVLWWLSSIFLQPKIQEVFSLTMVIFPGLVFICLYAFSGSLMQCYRSFFLPAVAPLIFNLVWIIFVFLAFFQNSSIDILAWGIVIAFFFQWFIIAKPSFFFVKKELSKEEWRSPRFFSSSLKGMIKPLSLAVIGVGAMQISGVIDSFFALSAEASGPTYLWYAIRIQQLPLALFGIALANALLPPLSRAMQENNLEKFQSFLQFAFKQSFAVMLPITIAILVLGGSSINLLYGRGAFSEKAVIETLYALWGYSVALIPASFVCILASGFYAKKNYLIPTVASICSVVFGVICNGIFVGIFHKTASYIALATGLSAWLNFFILVFYVMKSHPGFIDKAILVTFSKILLASFLAGLGVMALNLFGYQDPTWEAIFLQKREVFSRQFFSQLSLFTFQAIVFFGILFGSAKILKAKEIFGLLKRSPKISEFDSALSKEEI